MAVDKGFIDGILSGIGAPITAQNEAVLSAWAARENTKAGYNPFAVTQPASGATNFNSVGVKNYPDAATGIAATITLLTNGFYKNIVAGLRNNAPSSYYSSNAVAPEFSTYSGHGYTGLTVDAINKFVSDPIGFQAGIIQGQAAVIQSNNPASTFLSTLGAGTEEAIFMGTLGLLGLGLIVLGAYFVGKPVIDPVLKAGVKAAGTAAL